MKAIYFKQNLYKLVENNCVLLYMYLYSNCVSIESTIELVLNRFE